MSLNELLAVLLSWASTLSGYPMQPLPEVRFEDHAFFVEHACGGVECNVAGWYDDANVVYIDERYRNLDSGFATSLIVHEFTHYLQHKSGRFDSLSCEDSIAREREAYHVQTLYAIENLATVRVIRHPSPVHCAYAVDIAPEL